MQGKEQEGTQTHPRGGVTLRAARKVVTRVPRASLCGNAPAARGNGRALRGQEPGEAAVGGDEPAAERALARPRDAGGRRDPPSPTQDPPRAAGA